MPFAWIHRREEPVAFALAWIVPSWIVFEAVPTKLPHYTLPLLPAVAILTVMAIARHFVGPHRPAAKLATILIPFIPVGLTIGLSAVGWTFDGMLPFRALPALVISSLLALLGLVAFREEPDGPDPLGELRLGGLPRHRRLRLRPARPALAQAVADRLAEVARNVPCENPQVATLGYREPSLVFLTGTESRHGRDRGRGRRFLRPGGCRVVFVEKRFEGEFRAENERLKQQPVLSTRVQGFNINSGRRVDIAAYATGF